MTRLPMNESGSILVWTAVGLAVFIAFAGLATDIPYLYVARQQAQTAADAGAIAGAYGLLVSQTKAGTDGKAFAGKTPIIGQLLTAAQVDVFTCDSEGGTIGKCDASDANDPSPDQVTTITHRDVAHSNPMPLFLLRVLKLDAANVSAAATARLTSLSSGGCFKPLAPPDKPYRFPDDNGLQLTLQIGTPPTVDFGAFYPINFDPDEPPVKHYHDNLERCGDNSFVRVGDQLLTVNGSMAELVDATVRGINDLIEADPNASWDTTCNCMVNSNPDPTKLVDGQTPRIIRIPLFDPGSVKPAGCTVCTVTVANVAGFFIESVNETTGAVTGRLTVVLFQGGTPTAANTLFRVVQLVQ